MHDTVVVDAIRKSDTVSASVVFHSFFFFFFFARRRVNYIFCDRNDAVLENVVSEITSTVLENGSPLRFHLKNYKYNNTLLFCKACLPFSGRVCLGYCSGYHLVTIKAYNMINYKQDKRVIFDLQHWVMSFYNTGIFSRPMEVRV